MCLGVDGDLNILDDYFIRLFIMLLLVGLCSILCLLCLLFCIILIIMFWVGGFIVSWFGWCW